MYLLLEEPASSNLAASGIDDKVHSQLMEWRCLCWLLWEVKIGRSLIIIQDMYTHKDTIVPLYIDICRDNLK